MMMQKGLATPERARQMRLVLISIAILLLALASTLSVSTAQEEQQQNQQRRPRRVGDAQTTQPTPTPAPTPAGEEVDEGDIVRVDTQLVSIPAVVTDSAGRPLTNLRASNFIVSEDGRPQVISNFATTEAPFEVALLLDTSGSTRADVALIRRAANNFIGALRAGDRVAIVAFNAAHEGVNELAKVDVKTKLTSDRAVLRRAVENVGTSNGTPYYEALQIVAENIFHEPPREELRGRRAIVALTDGVDSASNIDYADARRSLLRSGIACYFIQVNTEDFVEDRLIKDCDDNGTLKLSRKQLERYRKVFAPLTDATDYANFCQLGQFERMQISRSLYSLARQEMNDLARASGGKSFPASDLNDARSAFAEVATEIGTQYSLGYYSTNKTRDGRFRAIKVEIRGVATGAKVRAREGYYAPRS